MAPALAVDPDRDEDRLRLDHPVEPDLLVPRIEDQIGIRLVEPALGKAPEQSIQALVDPADGARRERVPAQFFRHGLDLAGGHALDIHLGQRTHQGLLGPLKPVKQLGREPPLAFARDPQLQLADPRHQPAAVIAGPIPGANSRALPQARAHGLGHLGFQDLLQGLLQQALEQLAVFADQGFDPRGLRATLAAGGHGVTPFVSRSTSTSNLVP